jgi:hypothetical protein
MQAEIQQLISEHVRSITCEVCGDKLSFEVVVLPFEIEKTRVVAIAKATHCGRKYTVRARREDKATAAANA